MRVLGGKAEKGVGCMYVYDAWWGGVCFVLWENQDVVCKDLQGVWWRRIDSMLWWWEWSDLLIAGGTYGCV